MLNQALDPYYFNMWDKSCQEEVVLIFVINTAVKWLADRYGMKYDMFITFYACHEHQRHTDNKQVIWGMNTMVH